MSKVLISCCNGSGNIHKLVAFAAIRMIQDPRHKSTFIAPTHSPYVNNLHHVVEDFLKGGYDFWLNMDDDNPPIFTPGRSPLDLVDLNLDVVGLPTPVWHSAVPGDRPYYLNALHEVDPVEGFKPLDADPSFECRGLKPAEAVGTGCVMIARRVIRTLMEKAQGNAMEMPFMRRWCPQTGKVIMGNDYAFCQRARAAGFKIWAHFDYRCQHFNRLELNETISAIVSSMLKR